jgi:hypothetical protein
MKRWIWLFVILGLAAATPRPAAGQVSENAAVDLELILLADGSGSVDSQEFELQRLGYVRALRDPHIITAILSGPLRRIALAYVEWSGPELQVPIVDWRLIRSKADITDFAKRLEDTPRRLFSGGTAIGNAILYGVRAINENAFEGRRKVIDIYGDGPDIDGLPASIGRDRAVAGGMTVNGLPILEGFDDLGKFFRKIVIGGPGAFAVPARGFQDFTRAVRRKLIREIAAYGAPDQTPALAAVRLPGSASAPCFPGCAAFRR